MRKTGKKSQRGEALLEFALGFSVLWALFAGVFQFGYTFYIYNNLMTSVANAAALGSKMNYDTANSTQFTNAVTNMAVYGSTSSGSTPLVAGLSSSNVSVNTNFVNGSNGTAIPTNITVTINNFTVNSVFSSFTFNGKPSVTMAYTGRITCSTC